MTVIDQRIVRCTNILLVYPYCTQRHERVGACGIKIRITVKILRNYECDGQFGNVTLHERYFLTFFLWVCFVSQWGPHPSLFPLSRVFHISQSFFSLSLSSSFHHSSIYLFLHLSLKFSPPFTSTSVETRTHHPPH